MYEYHEHLTHPGYGWITPIMDEDCPLIESTIAEEIVGLLNGMNTPAQGETVKGGDGVAVTHRKAFVCASCHGVYADQPVSACDCTPDEDVFIEGTITYPAQVQPSGNAAPVTAQAEQSDRTAEQIRSALDNATDESVLSFSAKEVRGLLFTIKNQQDRIERFERLQQQVSGADYLPDSDIEQMAVNRYRPVPSGALAYKVVAGDGSRSLFSGTKDECQIVARKLTEAFLDGAHVALQAQPQPSGNAGELIEKLEDLLRDFADEPETPYRWYAEKIAALAAQASGQDKVDADRYRHVRRRIGAERTNGGKGPVSYYLLMRTPASDALAAETDAAIDADRAAAKGVA